jgi:chaperonin GroES
MFKPIRDVIIVKKSDAAERTKGGIYIPATVESKTMFAGVVVAAGDGILTESGKIVELMVKVGDKVVFGKTGCVDIVVDGENFVMMRENNILGIE